MQEWQEPLYKSVGKRLPWLILLFGLGMLVSATVGLFERVVENLTLIVSFQSLILGMAGNVGTQSLAVTVRLLRGEHLCRREKFALVGKEARIGFCNGFLLGILAFLLIGSYLLLRGETAFTAFAVSGCIGIALVLSMLLSSVAGTVIPLVLFELRVDPAVASGPFITTLSDLVAVVTYYGFAWIFLRHLWQ